MQVQVNPQVEQAAKRSGWAERPKKIVQAGDAVPR